MSGMGFLHVRRIYSRCVLVSLTRSLSTRTQTRGNSVLSFLRLQVLLLRCFYTVLSRVEYRSIGVRLREGKGIAKLAKCESEKND